MTTTTAAGTSITILTTAGTLAITNAIQAANDSAISLTAPGGMTATVAVGLGGSASDLVLHSTGGGIGTSIGSRFLTNVGIIEASAAGNIYIGETTGAQLGGGTYGITTSSGLVDISAGGALNMGNALTTTAAGTTIAIASTLGGITINNNIQAAGNASISLTSTGAGSGITPAGGIVGLSATTGSALIVNTDGAVGSAGNRLPVKVAVLRTVTNSPTQIYATANTFGTASSISLGDGTNGVSTPTLDIVSSLPIIQGSQSLSISSNLIIKTLGVASPALNLTAATANSIANFSVNVRDGSDLATSNGTISIALASSSVVQGLESSGVIHIAATTAGAITQAGAITSSAGAPSLLLSGTRPITLDHAGNLIAKLAADSTTAAADIIVYDALPAGLIIDAVTDGSTVNGITSALANRTITAEGPISQTQALNALTLVVSTKVDTTGAKIDLGSASNSVSNINLQSLDKTTGTTVEGGEIRFRAGSAFAVDLIRTTANVELNALGGAATESAGAGNYIQAAGLYLAGTQNFTLTKSTTTLNQVPKLAADTTGSIAFQGTGDISVDSVTTNSVAHLGIDSAGAARAVAITSGSATARTGGAVSQAQYIKKASTLTVTTINDVTAKAITLNNPANDVAKATLKVTSDGAAATNADIGLVVNEAAGLVIGGLLTAGNAVISNSAGLITDATGGPSAIGGTTNLSAWNGAATYYTISLTNAANDFGSTVTVGSAGNARALGLSIYDVNALNLGTITTAGGGRRPRAHERRLRPHGRRGHRHERGVRDGSPANERRGREGPPRRGYHDQGTDDIFQ